MSAVETMRRRRGDGTDYLPEAVIDKKLLEQRIAMSAEFGAQVATVAANVGGNTSGIAALRATVDGLDGKFDSFVAEQRKANEQAVESRTAIHAEMTGMNVRLKAVERVTNKTHSRQNWMLELLSPKRLLSSLGAVGIAISAANREWIKAMPWMRSHSELLDFIFEPLLAVAFIALVGYAVRRAPQGFVVVKQPAEDAK